MPHVLISTGIYSSHVLFDNEINKITYWRNIFFIHVYECITGVSSVADVLLDHPCVDFCEVVGWLMVLSSRLVVFISARCPDRKPSPGIMHP